MPADTELYCRVEAPKGSALGQSGTVVERECVVVCPADYCHFPDTPANAGRPLEAIVGCVGAFGGILRDGDEARRLSVPKGADGFYCRSPGPA